MSGTVLRELAARLGFEVDKKGFNEAEKAVDGIKASFRDANGRLRDAKGKFLGTGGAAKKGGADAKGAATAVGKAADTASRVLETLGEVAATVGLTHFLKSVVEMASDANETGNALNALFGAKGQQQVQEWAETSSKSLGRSKYDLQNYAARLGSLIDPMVGSKEKAQEMATTLAGLSVDMASFFNTADDDAMVALRSGLSGETEPLKRYGIVLTDVVLQEYAHTQGITKKVQKMGIAEKTQLRYNYILKATKTAQGDAARTGNGYANASKALVGHLKDFATDMGRAVIPRIESFVRWARDALASFKAFTQGTFALESAMYTLAGVATLLGIKLALPFVPMALAIGGIILLVDELYNLFTGGKSAIGTSLDKMFGEGTADNVVRTLRDTTRELFDLWEELPDWQASWELLGASIDGVSEAIEAVLRKMTSLVTGPLSWFKNIDLDFSRKLYSKLGMKETVKQIDDERTQREGQEMGRVTERGMADQVAVTTTRNRLGVGRQQRIADIYAEAQARKDARAKLREDRAKAAEDAQRKATGYEDSATGMSVAPEAPTPEDPDKLRFGRARASSTDWSVRAPAPAPSAPPMSSTPGTANMSVNVGGTNITVNSNNAQDVARIVKAQMETERRKTIAAIASVGSR